MTPRTEASQASPAVPPSSTPVLPWRALGHLATVVAILFAVSLVPYFDARLEDYRYWDRVDASPLLRAATFTPPPQPEAALLAGMPAAKDDDEGEISGDDLDKLAGVTVAGAKAGALPTAGDNEVGEPLELAEADTPTAPGHRTAVASAEGPLDIEAKAFGDQKVWLQDPQATLDPFFRALVELAQGRRTYVRIAHYGDSHTANDGITHVVRQLLQRRFGDGGHGFTLVEGRTQWYVHKGIKRTSSGGWELVNFLTGNAKDGAYGFGGVAADGAPGATFGLATVPKHPASRMTLYYRSRGRATITATLNKKALAPLEIDTAPGTDGSYTWTAPDGVQAMQWRVKAGRVRVYGGALERDRGLIYDSLGEVGARGTRWLNADAKHLEGQMRDRPVDLLILNYGGNERTDKLSEADYLDQMKQSVARMRAGHPQGACLLLGPGDHGVKRRGKVVSDATVWKINQWQQKLAGQVGCGYFDAIALMGGQGSMGRWVSAGLGWADYSHFTPRGEQAMGVGIYRALLKGLEQHLQRVKGTTAKAD